MKELLNLLPALIVVGAICLGFCLLEWGFLLLCRVSPRFCRWVKKKSEECPALADDWEED